MTPKKVLVIGIEQNEFMRRVEGTFKQSIKYVNWTHNNGDFYHHPFSRYRPGPIDQSSRRWLMSNRSIPFTETVSAQPIICELGLSPQMMGHWDFGQPLTYAYHMNALKFADYLCELSTAKGVTHHVDHVVDIEMAENGNIAAVKTRSGQRLESDLFIDCTGFAAILIEKQMGVKWMDCSQWLLCDRAVTMHVPTSTTIRAMCGRIRQRQRYRLDGYGKFRCRTRSHWAMCTLAHTLMRKKPVRNCVRSRARIRNLWTAG